MAKTHNIASDLVVEDWKSLIPKGRVADAVVIALMDKDHVEAVRAFAAQGYHILCEKVCDRLESLDVIGFDLTKPFLPRQPIATQLEECIEIVDVVEKNNVIFGCGHGECSRLTWIVGQPLIHEPLQL